MNCFADRLLVIAAITAGALSVQAGINPFNSQRAIIIYTNSTDSTYNLGSTNLYTDYFASTVNGVNQVYEASGVDYRLQIAGVVWDKTYSELYTAYPVKERGCYNRQDLDLGTHGMGRYRDLLSKYAAEMLILIHQNSPGGCGDDILHAKLRGYSTFWAWSPDNVYTWAHEIGHSQGLDHCAGHRVTLDSNGVEIGGPIPNDTSVMLGTSFAPSGITNHFVNDTVETTKNAARGFYTTMAYGDGGNGFSGECSKSIANTYNGVTRVFLFAHHGAWGGLDIMSWTGTFSGPDIYWTDTLTNTSFRTGADSMKYIDRLKYIGASTESYRDTMPTYYLNYRRNNVAVLEAYEDTLTHLKGVPSSVIIDSSMSLGPNSADSQWVYAHFAATDSVKILSGFSVTGNATLKIEVGSGSGSLAKRGPSVPGPQVARVTGVGKSSFRLQGTDMVFLSLSSEAHVTLDAFSLNGRHVATLLSERLPAGSYNRSLNVSGLSRGLYVYRLKAGNLVDTRKVMLGR